MNTDTAIVGKTALTESIIGAAYSVSNTLGCGFLEKVYENALALELRLAGHQVEQQRETPVYYKGELVGIYQADLVVDDEVIVELKNVRTLEPVHRAQCLNYLRAAGKNVGLVINFALPRIAVQRVQAFS
jgi:GxxExxY protein